MLIIFMRPIDSFRAPPRSVNDPSYCCATSKYHQPNRIRIRISIRIRIRIRIRICIRIRIRIRIRILSCSGNAVYANAHLHRTVRINNPSHHQQ